jgi:predicted hydrocarbon binding protein
MHGTMFVELRKFVEDSYGNAAWPQVLAAAGLGPRIYLPITSYPDEELAALVVAASAITGRSAPQLLESFGEHVAPGLLAMYRHLLDPAWRTLDVLEHVEETAHRAVRLEQRGAAPPYLEAERTSKQRIRIRYTSNRRLCHVAKGIINGLAHHFGDTIEVDESSCMHRGAAQCILVVDSV